MWKIIAYNLFFCFLCLLVIELFFGKWFSQNQLSDLKIRRNLTYHYDVSHLYSSEKSSTITVHRDEYGLRGNYLDPSLIDVLTVGGSTTEQAYIGDGETWQDFAAKCLTAKLERPVHFANAGVDGQTTFGHLKNFELWFPNIPNLRPKYILLYIGINDRVLAEDHSLFEFDKLDLKDANFWTIFKAKSALVHLVKIINGTWLAYKMKLSHRKVDFSNVHWSVTKPLVQDYSFTQGHVEAFGRRLRALNHYIRAMGAKPIFVTQMPHFYKSVNGKIVGADQATPKFGDTEVNALDQYIIQMKFNHKTMQVCKEVSGVCLNLATELDFLDSDFYDWVHNNPEGTTKIGDYLCSRLNTYL